MNTLIVPALPQTPASGWRRVLARPWETTQGCIFVLAAWCGVLFFYGIHSGELCRTEGLRAIIAQEMLATGDWVVPRLYGEPLFTKPPGMYLAIVLCSWPVGAVTEWSARLPSALAGLATVFMFFAFVRRYLGRPGGLAAALILPMSGMWIEKASAAEIDMLQVAWVTGALVCFFRAVEEEEKRGRPGLWWHGATLGMALGVLTKWTAPAFFYATAVAFLWWRGRWRLLLARHHLLGLVVALSLCLAWGLTAVSRTGWDVFYETIKREGLSRLVPNYDRPYRWGEAVLHPLVLLAATLPWSVLALVALRPGFSRLWDDRGRFLLQALHAWAWPNVLVWSYMSEHTPRHSFPLFPGIAGLAAMVWCAWQQGKLPVAWTTMPLKPRQLLTGMLALWLTVKVVYVEVIFPYRNTQQRREKAERLSSLVPAGHTLYLFRVKDEGLMYYYGRPVLRVGSWHDLPASEEATYCVLVPGEWEQLAAERAAERIGELVDEHGRPMLLVRLVPRSV